MRDLATPDGLEAVRASDQGGFDIILMDCQMPNLDGYEATKRIRRREEITGGRIPIVAMTANAFESDREKCFEAGMEGYLTKPIDKHVLLEEVRKWVEAAAVTNNV